MKRSKPSIVVVLTRHLETAINDLEISWELYKAERDKESGKSRLDRYLYNLNRCQTIQRRIRSNSQP